MLGLSRKRVVRNPREDWRTRPHVPLHLLQSLRDSYRAAPGSTVKGLSERFMVSWKTCYEVLAAVGRPGWSNLIRDRIENASAIQERMHARVFPEFDAAEKYLRIIDLEADRAKGRRTQPKKKKRIPYVSMIGASVREAAKRRCAARSAITAAERSAELAAERERNAQIRERVQRTKDEHVGLRYIPPRR